MSETSPILNLPKIGYWWSDKKNKKLNVNHFIDLCRQNGFELVKINLDQSLEEQGPFVAIVHKLSEYVAKAEEGDEKSQAICKDFEDYTKHHPEVIIINPISNPHMLDLLDRFNQYKIFENIGLNKEDGYFVPAFVEFTTSNMEENLKKMENASVTFPFVCKPSVAHGKPSHEMSIVFNEQGLNDISIPCVAQTFINHNAVLYKLFVIGNKYFMIERPSLKNFNAGNFKTIFFNSHNVSKPNSVSALTELDESELKTPTIRPDKKCLDRIVYELCKEIKMELLGIDIIIDNITGNYGIVDVNIFPGYDEIGNFFELLTDMILKRLSLKETECDLKPVLCHLFSNNDEKSSNVEQCICCPINGDCHNASKTEEKLFKSETFLSFDNAQDDSGIETSDSCDEKKKVTSLRNTKKQHFKASHLLNVEELVN